MIKKILSIFAALFLVACDGRDLTGRWVEPIPGMEHMTQGIEISPHGRAQSINMATLQYSAWHRDGDTLTLTGRSIGNGQTIDFTETYDIEKLTRDELILRRGDQIIKYTRK